MAPPPSNPARRRPSSAAGAVPPARPRRPTGQVPVQKPSESGSKLVCLAGPQAGSEYVLEGDEMVIGRAADNAVSIPDTSVSRKHVLLRNTGDGWAASDMGSGNGTLVNNNAIAEETPLSNGDVITLGDTELKFVAEGDPASSTRVTWPLRWRGAAESCLCAAEGARGPRCGCRATACRRSTPRRRRGGASSSFAFCQRLGRKYPGLVFGGLDPGGRRRRVRLALSAGKPSSPS